MQGLFFVYIEVMQTEFNLGAKEIESKISECVKNGMNEFVLHDFSYANDKGKMLGFLKTVQRTAPELFVSFNINPRILDMDVCRQCMNINCSIEMNFEAIPSDSKKTDVKKSVLFFDKKFYAKRCETLNNSGLVFGINLFFADKNGDSLKAFCDRLNFTIEQYPNHIDFPQTENSEEMASAKVSGTFSAEDIRAARNIAFACRTFYSAGRAVPWFNSILSALRITPSAFFSDFAEWQRCNNCDYNSGFVPENVSHHEIEKMQLLFLQQKFEEKHKSHMFTAANDIVCVNGALSRLVSDGTESVLETDYNPEEIFGPEAMDLNSFVNDLCMEHCTVKVFLNEDGEPDFKIL